jgi:4-amino-4-deoxy-L-arabinose transferase-like glycosyltransferase
MKQNKKQQIHASSPAAPPGKATSAPVNANGTAPVWPRGRSLTIFLLILLAGAVLRLFLLGRASYMIDEVNVVRFALDSTSLSNIYDTELTRFTFMHRLPLLMMLIRIAIHSLGSPADHFPPEWITRLPMALLGIATLPLCFLLGRRLKDDATGLWCMALMSFSIFHVYYSREAYDYSIVVFFVVAVFLTSCEIIMNWIGGRIAPMRWLVAHVAATTGLLYSHLICLPFLSIWNCCLALLVLTSRPWRDTFRVRALLPFILVAGLPYFLFLPFILKLGGGFVNQDSPDARRFSLDVIPTLIGRMGWGQAWYALIPFSVCLLAGLATASWRLRKSARFIVLFILLQGLAYFVVQSIMLRYSRFEVRYYSPLFPILLVVASLGITELVSRGTSRLPRLKPAPAHFMIFATMLLLCLPSLIEVCRLHCRGYDYKGIAEWINKNVPAGGTYSFYNVTDLSAIPSVYDTPGRTPTSVAAWTTEESYHRAQPPRRVIDFFRRFPQIVFIEVPPTDLLVPDSTADKIERDRVFARREWVDDPACARLLRWQTHPFGDAQTVSAIMQKALISYNRPEDLAGLAQRSGRSFYHRFGNGWAYTNDQGFNHWLVLRDTGEIFAGNTSSNSAPADIRIMMMTPALAFRVHVMDAQNKQIASFDIGNRNLGEITIPGQILQPGETTYRLKAVPLSASAEKAVALLYAVEINPAKAPAMSASGDAK